MNMKRILSFLMCFMILSSYAVFAQGSDPFEGKDTLNIVFLGGSITEGVGSSSYKSSEVDYVNKDGSIVFPNCYAGEVGSYFKEKYKNKTVNIYNSGIGGTNSMLGLYRLRDEVICYDPDMVFVEFAVNDQNAPAQGAIYMEAIVRELLKLENPPIINFIYTTDESFKTARIEHHKVADYYGIPEHDLQSVVEAEVASGKYKIRELLGDGTHPTDTGHKLYADSIIKNLETGNFYKKCEKKEDKLSRESFDFPRIENAKGAENDGNWYIGNTNGRDTYITTGVLGATLKFSFYGTKFGLLIACSAKGSAEVFIDGKKIGDVTPYGAMMNLNFYRDGLKDAEHTAEIKVKADSSGNIGLGICGFLVDGYEKGTDSEDETEDIGKYGKNIYVSPNGDDNNPATIEQPIKSIKKAKNIAAQKVKAASGDVNIILRGGRYDLGDGLNFDMNSSGKENAKINFSAYEGEEVIFSNAREIPSDKFSLVSDEKILKRIPESARKKVYQVSFADAGIKDSGMMTDESMGISLSTTGSVGRRMLTEKDDLYTIARWPNEGFANIESVIQTSSGHKFHYSENKGDTWKTADQAWIYGYFMWLWADRAMAVSEFDCDNKTISTAQADYYGMTADKPYFVYNLLEELDIPGEWFADANKKILYVYPKKDIEECEFYFAGKSDALVTLKNASYITFNNIIFDGACANAFMIEKGNYNEIKNCTIRNIGHHAVDIVGGTHNKVEDTYIHDIGRGGVFISGGDFVNLTPSENVVKNCHIERYAINGRTYSAAVALFGVGDIASHNEINNASHMAVYFKGNNNIIEYNEIYDVLKYTNDMGAIYAGRSWVNGGTVIRYNYIHDCRGEGFQDAIWFTQGIYLDDGFADVKIYGNVFDGLNNGIFLHYARNITMENNIFNDCKNSIVIRNPGGTTDWAKMENYKTNYKKYKEEGRLAEYSEINFATLYSTYQKMYNPENNVWNENYPYLANMLDSDWMVPENNVIKSNLIYGSKEDSVLIPENIADITVSENNFIDDVTKPSDYLSSSGNISGFEKIDINLCGTEKENGIVGNFGGVYPPNGEINVNADNLIMMWENAAGANVYRLTIAEDKNFSKIIFDDETDKNFAVLPRLKFGCQKYYWKVGAYSTAVGYKRELKYNKDGVMSFRTAASETLFVNDLKKAIAAAKNIYDKAVEGTEPGEYFIGSKAAFKNVIDSSEDALLYKESLSPYISRQGSIDAAKNGLQRQTENFKVSRNIMTVNIADLLADGSGWYRSKPEGSRVTFSGNGNYGYTGSKLESYKKLKFNLSYEFLNENAWFCFELKSQSLSVQPWSTQCYIFLVKPNVLELQKFNGSETFYYTAENNILSDGKTHEVVFGTVKEKSGVRVTVSIDGNEIFNYLDDHAPIEEEGYFGAYISGKANVTVSKSE